MGVTRLPLGQCAWVYFNGSGTPGVIVGQSVSSITDHGVGDYTANLSITMSSANLCAVASCSDGATRISGFTATTVHVLAMDTAGSPVDAAYVMISVSGVPTT